MPPLTLMVLTVCETFYSLLGESSLAGAPAFFIRLTGCNLRCRYCDTRYAYEGGEEVAVAALIDAARAQPTRVVLVTGGEPLLQTDTLPLLCGLADTGFTVLLETNGSLPIAPVDRRVRRILDIKCPGSGMAGHNDWNNLALLTPRDEVKFVVSEEADFAWALEIIRQHQLLDRAPVLISPVFGLVPAREAANWILTSRLPLRLNLQLHKYIWGPETRGV
jgi:7-carboxy-7-deazaguanine synthase